LEVPGSFGEWLKQRRKALDLTQDELAERAGCSIFALRKIESGERRPSKQLAALLATALEISEEEQPTFVRVARGDLNLERLRLSRPNTSPPSISDFLDQQQTPESAPPHTSPKPAPHHLPLSPTPLLGRDTELAALERLFKDSQCRLLTLTGMGGIGKTRLAIEFASRQREMFADGVHYVPLASVNSPESIVPAVADALEFSFSGPGGSKEQLLNYMSIRMKGPALLVLDNLEHLIVQSSETVDLISEFLQRLHHLKILTTSRERLNLHGEWMYELHGLPVPPVEFVDRLDEYSAAVLFIQRAKHVKTEFVISDSERGDLVQICRLVEGTPLAIELAAAWVGMLTCNEIAREIESNIDFLSTSMRDMPERHRSLRATFDHSWKLLSDQERDVLSCLSVFRGGFDRNAAEKVAGATLPLLASLVSKSLVRRAETGHYDLHEVIRQYASSHLDEDEARCLETCDRHSDYYLKFASGHERKLKSALQQPAVREMTLELDNMRTAWDWGIKRGKFEAIGMAVRSIGWFYEVSGMLREGIEQLEPLAQALKSGANVGQWNRVLGLARMQQALLYFRKGQFSEAQRLYEESIAILRPIGDQALLADALIFLGTIMHLNGEYERSKLLLEEGLVYARAVNDRWFTAYGIYNLGYFDSLMGEYEKGYRQMLIGLNMWRELGDPNYIALGLNFMVTTIIKLEHYDEAKTFMHESIKLCEQTKNHWGLGTAHRYLGLALMAEGQYGEAQTCFQRSLDVFGEYTEGWDIALSLIYLGDAIMRSGNPAEAENNYKEALRVSKEAGSTPLVLDALGGIAEIHHRRGNFERAFELTYFVLNHPACSQDSKDRASQILSEMDKLSGNEHEGVSQEKISNQSLKELIEAILK
jgi:predicted ATPase/transcriptional regulator with XRE-family HTH domain